MKSKLTDKQKTVIAVTIVILGAIVILSSVFSGLASQITGAFGVGEATNIIDELEETNDRLAESAEDASPEIQDLIEEQAEQIEELQETVTESAGPKDHYFYPIIPGPLY